ncbi:hypothetical protein M758_7G133500 [Ceratodon purpureus]|nr:hypothetical protein M758_7G133500 [Ceratodon purpureus]
MTEVADGNPVTMSATQDTSSLDRPEVFVSSGLSPCSNDSLGGALKIPVENAVNPDADRETQVEGGASGKTTSESNILPGEVAASHDEVALLAEKQEVLVEADGSKTSLGSPQQDSKDGSIEEPASDAPNAEIADVLPAVEASAVKISTVETLTVETTTVETSAVENPTEETPAVIVFNVETHATEISTMETHSTETSTVETHTTEISAVETHAVELPVKADLKEEVILVVENAPSKDVVQDVVSGVDKTGGEAEDVIMKDTSADQDAGVQQESLPSPTKDERQDIASESTTVEEAKSTGTEDAAQQSLHKSEVLQNGVTRMVEAVSATNHIISLSATTVTRVENEVVNSIADDTTGRTVDETADKLTEDTGEKLVDEMADRIASKFPGGVADRMADAIADEIADQIADRMADEIADKMADEMADGIADDMADRMADEMADRMADEMADRMADEMADRMADEMADRMADEMAAEMADELADEMADEVIEGDYGRSEGGHENERMDEEENHEVGDMEEEEEMAEDVNKAIDDDYEDDEGTPEEQMAFVEELERFFKQRSLEYKAPKFYGLELNVLKLWRVVSKYGGYDHVTVSKLWRTVGEEFKPPKTCTTISWSFRGFYEKALLDYERFKTGVSAPDSNQRAIQTTGFYLANDQRTASPATPSSEPNMGGTPGSGSGRARRDAAARAMQGWHSQRMGNGDAKEPNPKEKGSGGKHVKKEKKLTNIGRSYEELPTEATLDHDAGGNGLKRKGSNLDLQRAVKAVQARGRPRLYEDSPPSNSAVTGKRSMKQQDSGRRPMKVAKVDGPVGGFDPPIVDEGPKADWVKINVHKHLDCFEIYALVPGLAREEVRIQCEPGGRLVIAGMPEDPENPWGVTPFRKVISLPSRIDAHQTSAVVTLYGQLYVRVPIAEDKSS